MDGNKGEFEWDLKKFYAILTHRLASHIKLLLIVMVTGSEPKESYRILIINKPGRISKRQI